MKKPALFVALAWIVFFVNSITPFELNQWGLVPRSMGHIPGILAMPFLHANWEHLLSNTIPLVILIGLLLMTVNHKSTEILISIAILGGVLLWAFGRPATHIGASGVVYGLATYLIVSGWSHRKLLPLFASLFVVFIFGGTLMAGVIPTDSQISWDGHLLGGAAGFIIGLVSKEEENHDPIT